MAANFDIGAVVRQLIDAATTPMADELRRRRAEEQSRMLREEQEGKLELQRTTDLGASARQRLANEGEAAVANIRGGYDIRGRELEGGAQRDVARTYGGAQVESARLGATSRQELAEATLTGRMQSADQVSRDRLEAARLAAASRDDPTMALLRNPAISSMDPAALNTLLNRLSGPGAGPDPRSFDKPTAGAGPATMLPGASSSPAPLRTAPAAAPPAPLRPPPDTSARIVSSGVGLPTGQRLMLSTDQAGAIRATREAEDRRLAKQQEIWKRRRPIFGQGGIGYEPQQ